MATGIALIFFLGPAILNKGIQSNIETFGSRLTQTPVTLDDVNISVLSGKGTIKGLYVGNPEGFKKEFILVLEQIEIALDRKSLFSDKLVIDKIHIKQPQISLEQRLNTSNLKELQRNIEGFASSTSKTTREKKTPETKKQLIVKKLIIEDTRIYLSLIGQELNFTLSRIELDNLRKDNALSSIEQIIHLALSEVAKKL